MNRVLVCDDERKIRETYYDYLTAKGFEVTLASDGASTGMGLPICKRIFDLHSFSFSHYNVKNGVIFYFSGNTLK